MRRARWCWSIRTALPSTPTGVVNTGSFAASTLDIKNSDFLAGNYKFTGNGSSATVTNAGRINVSDGGFAALLGGRVANDGVISARLGKVGLGSGEMITLDLAGDGFLSVAVPSEQLGNLRDGTGQALVSNRGKIRADGGTVYLSAATANTILRDAVNVPGSIRANSVGTRDGRIVLGGGAGGRVTVSGRVSASGTRGRAGNRAGQRRQHRHHGRRNRAERRASQCVGRDRRRPHPHRRRLSGFRRSPARATRFDRFRKRDPRGRDRQAATAAPSSSGRTA